MNEDVNIMETAFVKYLKTLSIHERSKHLRECFLNQGEMAYELAEFMNEFQPTKLALKLEDQK